MQEKKSVLVGAVQDCDSGEDLAESELDEKTAWLANGTLGYKPGEIRLDLAFMGRSGKCLIAKIGDG